MNVELSAGSTAGFSIFTRSPPRGDKGGARETRLQPFAELQPDFSRRRGHRAADGGNSLLQLRMGEGCGGGGGERERGDNVDGEITQHQERPPNRGLPIESGKMSSRKKCSSATAPTLWPLAALIGISASRAICQVSAI